MRTIRPSEAKAPEPKRKVTELNSVGPKIIKNILVRTISGDDVIVNNLSVIRLQRPLPPSSGTIS